jgi:hypothetical protein
VRELFCAEKRKNYRRETMTVIEQNGTLSFTFDNGSGGTRRESIRGIKPSATDQDVYDCGTALTGLVSDALVEIRRTVSKTYSA